MHPDHGTVEPYNTTVPFPESARYTCDDSYYITGDTTRTCQSHGGWDGSEPSCIEIGTANLGIFARFYFPELHHNIYLRSKRQT